MNDIYIGWPDAEGNRGGHINGAIDFSAKWINGLYDQEASLEGKSLEELLAETLETKRIQADKDIIVYDTNGEDAQVVADYFASQGMDQVRLYDASKWIQDDSRELISYDNYEIVASAQTVNELIQGNYPEGFKEGADVVIVDVSWGEVEESGYLDGHIPSAVHINTDSYEPPKTYVDGVEEWRLADPETLADLLLANGIDKDTIVIATGPEPMASSRFAYLAKYMGVEDVRLLNGGFVNWQNQGFELETEEQEPTAKGDFGTAYPAQPEMLQTVEDVKDNMANNENYQLVDVRTWEEYIGQTSGYDYHNIAGRIEGAIYGRSGLNSSSSMYYWRNPDKTMRNLDEIETMLEDNKVNLDQPMTFMCGSGWRAAEAMWYAYAANRLEDNMFSDGWIAWSNEGNPFIVGEPGGDIQKFDGAKNASEKQGGAEPVETTGQEDEKAA